MRRSLKLAAMAIWLVALVCGAFAGGRQLGRLARSSARERGQVTALPGAGIGGLGESYQSDASKDPAGTFQAVLNYVRSEYVDKVPDERKLSAGAVRGMLLSLDDPKTRFLDPAQRKQLDDQMNGSFQGIGAVMAIVKQKRNDIDQRRLAIVAPVRGGPAEAAGLAGGDIITEVDGRWVIAYDPRLDLNRLQTREMDERAYRKAFRDATKRFADGITWPRAVDLLNAAGTKPVKLTVERAGAKGPLTMTVTCGATQVAPIETRRIRGVTYLRVPLLNDAAADAAVAAIAAAGSAPMVLDLRDNPGGPVVGPGAGVLRCASRLLARLGAGGQIGSVVRRGAKTEPITVDRGDATKRKIAVIVNRGTSNVAEMVAGALQAKAGAVVVGSPTFGDATYQRLVGLADGNAMVVNAGRMVAGGAVEFDGHGLKPTIAAPTAHGAADIAVDKAVTAVTGN